MFTDIKNSQNMSRSNCNETCNQEQWNTSNKRRRKTLKKLWQPLKRFVTLKATAIPKNCNNNNGNKNSTTTNNSIPNNVNLNNNAMTSSIVRQRLQGADVTEVVTNASIRLELTAMADTSLVTVPERVAVTVPVPMPVPVAGIEQRHEMDHSIPHHATFNEDNNKLPLDDRLIQYNEDDAPLKGLHVKLTPTKSQPLIQSVSIEKPTMNPCTNCIHGKNCLHMNANTVGKYEMDSCSQLTQLSSVPAIDAEVEHLREWLKQNSWHMLKNMS